MAGTGPSLCCWASATGRLPKRCTTPLGDEPLSVAIGDLNGDQVPDLAVANNRYFAADNVSILLGVGNGTFEDVVHYGAGYEPEFVAIGDLDGDRVPDLAVANYGSSNISVLLNQSFTDCNCNHIADECDIDCGPPGGPCDFPGCGQSEDDNGVPFECNNPVCGDGCQMGTEACDDGGESAECDIDCTVVECGDGTLNATAGEVCDDGNTEPGDGCDENCRFDLGACCLGSACSLATASDCLDAGGTFFRVNTTCDWPDADGDGLRNECDGCPSDAKKIEPGICGCGVDDNVDSDGDGVPDCVDQCRDVDDTTFAPECSDAIPTASAWGLLILALLLMTCSKTVFRLRHRFPLR